MRRFEMVTDDHLLTPGRDILFHGADDKMYPAQILRKIGYGAYQIRLEPGHETLEVYIERIAYVEDNHAME